LMGLLWSQALLALVFILPVFALSALTSGLVQFIYVILGPIVLSLGFEIVSPRFALIGLAVRYDWFRSYFAFLVIGAAALAILFWQYSRRRTNAARGLAVAAFVLVVAGFMLIPRSAALTIQSLLSEEDVDVSSIHAVPDFGRKLESESDNVWVTTRASRRGDGSVGVQILYQVLGLPPDKIARIMPISVSFEAPDGSTYKTDSFAWDPIGDSDHKYFLQTGPDLAFSRKIGDGPLNVHVSLYLTLYGNQQTTRLHFGDRFVQVPRVGACSTTDSGYQVLCHSAFRSPTALVSFHTIQSPTDNVKQVWSVAQRGMNAYSPFPSDISINPIDQVFEFSSGRFPLDEAAIDTAEPLAHVRLDFDITNLRVTDFRPLAPSISH
jgi:hypothetical protein